MNTNKEIWAWIEGFEGQYMVSTFGRIYSVERKQNNHSKLQNVKEKIKKHSDNGNGYKFIQLYSNGKNKRAYVHRLVAEALIPNPHNLPQVNHKDEDKSNNSVENLEWCDSKYNINYGTARIRDKETLLKNKNNRGIDVYDMDGNFIKTYKFSNEACNELGIRRRELYYVCDGITRSAKGYRFAYEGERLLPYSKGQKVKHRVQKFDMDGNLVSEYDSFKTADSSNGFCRGTMRHHFIKNKGEFIKNGYKYKQIS